MTTTDILDLQFSLILLIAFFTLINTVIAVITLSVVMGDLPGGYHNEP